MAFGLERFDQAHGLAALGAAQSPILGCWIGQLWVFLFSSVGVPEQPPDLVKQMAITVAEEAIIPDLDKAPGQDVLQETTDEFLGSDAAVPGFSGVRVFVAKDHTIISHIQDAVVADGHAKDIGGQILQSSYSAADGLTVNHPIFGPRLGGDQVK
jgi:hypothetical protein